MLDRPRRPVMVRSTNELTKTASGAAPPLARASFEAARHAGRPVAVLTVEADQRSLFAGLAAQLAEEDVRAWAVGGRCFALLVGRPLTDCRSLAEELAGSACASVGLAHGASAEAAGIEDLRLDTLVDVSAEGLEVAREHGGDQVVHTEL